MKRASLVAAALLLLMFPLLASAHGHNRHANGHSKHWNHGTSNQHQPTPTVPATGSPVVPPVVTPPIVPTLPTPPVGTSQEVRFIAYTTGYSWYDNTPAGSAEISNPVIHQFAGGSGTYADPITVAVGHSIAGNKDTLDYAAGTRFYIPNLKRYFIVEDTCGDGNSPQNGPCHTGYQGHVWLDVYVGKGSSKSASDQCMDAITETHLVIQNPGSGYPVSTGDIAANCTQYGDTI